MRRHTRTANGCRHWLISVALILVAAGATAQTVSSPDELRGALKNELAPLSLSIKQQARAVTGELAAGVIAELASSLRLGWPRAQLARRDAPSSEGDRS